MTPVALARSVVTGVAAGGLWSTIIRSTRTVPERLGGLRRRCSTSVRPSQSRCQAEARFTHRADGTSRWRACTAPPLGADYPRCRRRACASWSRLLPIASSAASAASAITTATRLYRGRDRMRRADLRGPAGDVRSPPRQRCRIELMRTAPLTITPPRERVPRPVRERAAPRRVSLLPPRNCSRQLASPPGGTIAAVGHAHTDSWL